MAKSDRINEEIGWLKVVFTLSIVSDASLLGWLAQNFAEGDRFLVSMGVACAFALSSVALFANRRAYRLIKELEDA